MNLGIIGTGGFAREVLQLALDIQKTDNQFNEINFVMFDDFFEHEFVENKYEASIEIECEFCPVDDITNYSSSSNDLNSYPKVVAVSFYQQSLLIRKSKKYHQRAPPKN